MTGSPGFSNPSRDSVKKAVITRHHPSPPVTHGKADRRDFEEALKFKFQSSVFNFFLNDR
jgi:hypothetical protein